MTDLRDQLARLFDDEPAAPYDIDEIVRSGRRARRRRNTALLAAGTVGAAGITAAVVVPALVAGGSEASDTLSVPPSPSPSPSASKGQCYLVYSRSNEVGREIKKLIRSGKVGEHPSISTVKAGNKRIRAVCTHGTSPADLQQGGHEEPQEPAGPPYTYTDKPEAISSRLGAALHDRVSDLGLTITYTRPFSQETSKLSSGHPSYFAGNVDVHESSGYADIGVQVTHRVTELVPFAGDCTEAEHCTETKLPDGSVMRTDQVKAGRGDLILTAEVHRPDGLVVQAQESDYPFGPDAGSQPHGDMPLTMDQLVKLAQDNAFTF